MPAATIAICSGVGATSHWPIADCAVCGSSVRSGVGLSTWRLRLAARSSKVGAEAELGGLRVQRVVADLRGRVAEGDVAGDVEGLGQGDAVAAAVAAVLVEQVGRRLGNVSVRRLSSVSVVYGPLVERGRGRHELECRAGRQHLLDPRLIASAFLVAVQRVPGLCTRRSRGWPAGRGRRSGWVAIASTAPVARVERDDGALVFLPSAAALRTRPSAPRGRW